MIILGIRTSTQEIRYAILDFQQDGTVKLLNGENENRLKFPASYDTIEKKLWWFYQELERIVRNQPIEKIMIKSNEYMRSDSSVSRTASYIDGVVYTFAGKMDIPVVMKMYRAMETRRDDVKTFAESNVGKTKANWNEQMADAVAVAFVGGVKK